MRETLREREREEKKIFLDYSLIINRNNRKSVWCDSSQIIIKFWKVNLNYI